MNYLIVFGGGDDIWFWFVRGGWSSLIIALSSCESINFAKEGSAAPRECSTNHRRAKYKSSVDSNTNQCGAYGNITHTEGNTNHRWVEDQPMWGAISSKMWSVRLTTKDDIKDKRNQQQWGARSKRDNAQQETR